VYGPEAEAELVEAMNTMLKNVWTFDPRVLLLPYKSNNINLSKDSNPFKSRTQIQVYCDNAFIKPNFNTWMKIYIAHDKVVEEYAEDDVFQAALSQVDLWFQLDKIQDKSSSSIGWLLGSTPDTGNINDMKLAHEHHPSLGIECEPRGQAIHLYPGRNNIPAVQQVKAIHIYVASGNVTTACRAYNLTFGGSTNSTGYPLGQVLWFLPDISDPCYPASMQTRAKVIRMMSKQKHLLTSTTFILTSTIAGLHVYYEDVGYTLCEILMGLRIGEDKAIPIFLSVAERLWGAGSNVVFSVKNDRLNEANTIIPLLCVVIEAKFGPGSHQWFTEDARLTSEGFYWDEQAQLLKQTADMSAAADDDDFSLASDDSYVANLTASLHLGDLEDMADHEGGVFNFDLDFVFNEDAPPNQYGNHASVNTFWDICAQTTQKKRRQLKLPPLLIPLDLMANRPRSIRWRAAILIPEMLHKPPMPAP
jgi:hypothetical protein